MSFDGIVVRALAHQLETTLKDGRIDKVNQPDHHELILQIHVHRQQFRLILNANPSCPMAVLTEAKRENPIAPPMFCMLLRKHLQGGRILAVGQSGMDRILWLDIESRDELGDLTTNRLHIEFMGKHSNIILYNLKTHRILDSISRIPESISRVRQVLPGITFYPLEVSKKNLLETSEAEFLETLRTTASGSLQKFLLSQFEGFSPQTVKELMFRAALPEDVALPLSPEAEKALCVELFQLKEDLTTHRYLPTLYRDANGTPSAFSVIPLTHRSSFNETSEAFPQPDTVVERFYTQKAQESRIRQKSAHLRKVIQTRMNRLEKKVGNLQEDYHYAENAENSKRLGDLLTANIYQVQRSMTTLEVVDFYDPEQNTCIIPLDVRLTPAENAQRFYHKYSKLKTARTEVLKQLEETREELVYLDTVMTTIDTSSEPSDIEQIQSELAKQGYIKTREKGSAKKKVKDTFAPLLYQTTDGFEVVVGRNNLENDRLTLKTASNADLWFHTKDIPGSHTVLKTLGQPVPDTSLTEAAQIAAWHSKGRQSENLPVDYTQIRHVRKPQGARPGMVIYDHQKTLYVTPVEDTIKALKK